MFAFSLVCALACAGPKDDRDETADGFADGDVDDSETEAPYVNIGSTSAECVGSNGYNYEFSAEVDGEPTDVWVELWVGEDMIGSVDLTARTGDWFEEAVPADFGSNRCIEVEEDLYVGFSASSNGDRVAEDTQAFDF
ncbi:MAG: hypothetical protein Q8P41_21635 [Pseudomonadota bacterium]|nr:hypothetical protein [Pseudomonadota bacterium]